MKPDDASIGDAVALFRRVHPKQVVWDGNENRLRPTNAAFRDAEMSVNLGDDLEREGLGPESALRKHNGHHLVSVTAGFARGEEQAVARNHIKDYPDYEDDPTHGEVCGQKPESRRKRFALAADWSVLRRDSLKEEHRERFEEGDYPDPTTQGDDEESVAA
jgi:hypothetical protein